MSREVRFDIPSRTYLMLLIIANEQGYLFRVGDFIRDVALEQLAEGLEAFDV